MNRYLLSKVTRVAAFVVVSLTTLFAITVPALAFVIPAGGVCGCCPRVLRTPI
jgi:hypothetical protein